jgi:hypothetical protein
MASIPLGLLRSVHRHQNAARELGAVLLSPARPHVIRARHGPRHGPRAMRQRAVGRAAASHAASPYICLYLPASP